MAQRPDSSFFRSVRLQIIALVLAALIIPLVVTQYISYVTSRAQLERDIAENLSIIAQSEADLISNNLLHQVNMVSLQADRIVVETAVRERNASYQGSQADIEAQLRRLDEQWDRLLDADTRVASTISGPLHDSLVGFQALFPDHAELIVTDRYGAVVASTFRTRDYLQTNEAWWQGAWNDGLGNVYFDNQITQAESANNIQGLILAVPIVANNEVIGIMRTLYRVDSIQSFLQAIAVGQTGESYIADRSGRIIISTDPGAIGSTAPDDLIPLLQGRIQPAPGTLFTTQDAKVAITRPISSNGLVSGLDNLGWSAVLLEAESEALAPINAALNAVLAPLAVVIVLGVIIALLSAQRLTQPLSKLSAATRRMAQGEYGVQVDISARNEYGELAATFNQMSTQLAELVGSLEKQVDDRTRDLQTVLDLSNQISTILDLDRLLQDVVDLIKERFGLYHAHIYLLDDEQKTLRLRAGAGYVGRQMVAEKRSIELSNVVSIVANAARSRSSVVIDNVLASPTFLPNPLLPNTRSELAIPLIARGQLVGILDVQSDQVSYFRPDIIAVLETTARQVASAINNASLFEIAERTSRHERAMGIVTQQAQTAQSIEEVLQITARELGKALRVSRAAVELNLTPAMTGEDKR